MKWNNNKYTYISVLYRQTDIFRKTKKDSPEMHAYIGISHGHVCMLEGLIQLLTNNKGEDNDFGWCQ